MFALLGGFAWGAVRDVVVRLQVSGLDGHYRRLLAVVELREAGIMLPLATLHLAIEAAVVWSLFYQGKRRCSCDGLTEI